MLKAPPGRFSITIGWPRPLCISSASARMKMSLVPPALVTVMTRIGRAG
jgi:hypothetical protein